MSRKSGWIGDLFVEGFALAIGWLVCMATVCGVYYLGFLAAPHLGWDSGSQTFGLLQPSHMFGFVSTGILMRSLIG
jgi:hypothetical protein